MGCDDVGETVVDEDFNLDIGVLRQDLSEYRHEDRVCGKFRCGDSDRASRVLAQFAQGRQLDIHLIELRPDLHEQSFASLSWRDAPGRAVQQPDPQSFFQVVYDLTECRLGDSELCRRSCEAALSGDR